MAAIPLSATDVRILRNVRLANDYKHTRYFESKEDQFAYFSSKPVVWSTLNSSFQKINNTESFVDASKHIDQMYGSNYIMFQNKDYGNRWFYGFVTRLEWKSDRTTRVYFELDVFQTWFLDVNFYRSFIVREHCPLWNTDGSPVINTVPEKLDYGSEYDVLDARNYKINNGIRWMVVVTKTPFHDGVQDDDKKKINPVMNSVPQPYTFYILPFHPSAGARVYVTITGTGASADYVDEPENILRGLYRSEDATNNIVSIYVTDDCGLDYLSSSGSFNITIQNSSTKQEVLRRTFTDDKGFAMQMFQVTKLIYATEKTFNTNDTKYNGLTDGITESKLLMYPYTLTVIQDNKGNQQEIKNEYIYGQDLTFEVKGSLGVSNTMSVALKFYNGTTSYGDQQNAMIDTTPNDVPVVNDYTTAFMQGNKNSLQTQKDQAAFNLFSGLVSNGITGAASIAAAPVTGGMSLFVGANAGSNLVSGLGTGLFQMESINSKIQDINNVPPNIQKQGSNTFYDNANYLYGISIIKKQIKPEYKRKLQNYFHAYGYAVRDVKYPNFHTRRHFNYIQTIEANIQGNIANDDLQKLRAIFDNGICLWHTDDIGNYSLTNEVL